MQGQSELEKGANVQSMDAEQVFVVPRGCFGIRAIRTAGTLSLPWHWQHFKDGRVVPSECQLRGLPEKCHFDVVNHLLALFRHAGS